jgi:hypothetical protein
MQKRRDAPAPRRPLLVLTLRAKRDVAEILRVLPCDVCVEVPDARQVGIEVAAGHEARPEASALALVVEVSQGNGHPGTEGDVVEARFPVPLLRPGALRRDGQGNPLHRLDVLHNLLHLVFLGRAVYGNAPEPAVEMALHALE